MRDKNLLLILVILFFAFCFGFNNSYQIERDKKAIDAFVMAMNDKAIAIGMQDTQFCDPTGLSYCNLGTAADVITLLKACVNDSIINSAWCKDSSTIQIIGNDSKIRNVTMYNTFLSDSITELPIYGRKTGSDGYIFNIAMVLKKESGLLYWAILNCCSEEERLRVCKTAIVDAHVSACNTMCYSGACGRSFRLQN